MEALAAIFLSNVVLGIFVYFMPGMLALLLRRQNSGPIVILNALLGWTVIGWWVFLLWSIFGKKSVPAEYPQLRNDVVAWCCYCGAAQKEMAGTCHSCGKPPLKFYPEAP